MTKPKLTNLWEEEVNTALDSLLEADSTICSCSQCRADMLAFALNRLKPMYTTPMGRGRMRYLLRAQRPRLREELNDLLAQAIVQVKERPRAECQRLQEANRGSERER